MQLVANREDLKEARLDAKTHRIRIELAAVEAAGGPKRFGDSAEIRERRLFLVGADDPECRRLDRRVAELEAAVARDEARFERAARAIRFWEWQIRNRLTDALDRLAGRPCSTNLEHQLQALLAEATGEKGVYAGESDWVETRRAG
jgi:hypothetical protein